MALITVTIRKTGPLLEVTPVDFAAHQEIRKRRLSLMRNGSPGKRNFLNLAFNHARQDPRHAGDPEPLLVLSSAEKDELIWEVLDVATRTPVANFMVQVHVFVDPMVVVTPSGVPDLFAFGSTPKAAVGGQVRSGLPTAAAEDNDFGWHKFLVIVPGAAPLDPCIFV